METYIILIFKIMPLKYEIFRYITHFAKNPAKFVFLHEEIKEKNLHV